MKSQKRQARERLHSRFNAYGYRVRYDGSLVRTLAVPRQFYEAVLMHPESETMLGFDHPVRVVIRKVLVTAIVSVHELPNFEAAHTFLKRMEGKAPPDA